MAAWWKLGWGATGVGLREVYSTVSNRVDHLLSIDCVMCWVGALVEVFSLYLCLQRVIRHGGVGGWVSLRDWGGVMTPDLFLVVPGVK